MKKAFSFSLVIIVFLLSGCCMFYESETQDNFILYENKHGDDCFLGTYIWDGSDDGKKIIIPDEYNGKAITSLGGYYGRGVPVGFDIDISEFYSPSDEYIVWSEVANPNENNTEIIYIDFELTIGKNITEVNNRLSLDYSLLKIKDSEPVCYRAYIPRFYVYVHSENEHFYSRDGKLYDKNTDELIDKEAGHYIYYYDYIHSFAD